jgi:hypothetical protein
MILFDNIARLSQRGGWGGGIVLVQMISIPAVVAPIEGGNNTLWNYVCIWIAGNTKVSTRNAHLLNRGRKNKRMGRRYLLSLC